MQRVGRLRRGRQRRRRSAAPRRPAAVLHRCTAAPLPQPGRRLLRHRPRRHGWLGHPPHRVARLSGPGAAAGGSPGRHAALDRPRLAQRDLRRRHTGAVLRGGPDRIRRARHQRPRRRLRAARAAPRLQRSAGGGRLPGLRGRRPPQLRAGLRADRPGELGDRPSGGLGLLRPRLRLRAARWLRLPGRRHPRLRSLRRERSRAAGAGRALRPLQQRRRPARRHGLRDVPRRALRLRRQRSAGDPRPSGLGAPRRGVQLQWSRPPRRYGLHVLERALRGHGAGRRRPGPAGCAHPSRQPPAGRRNAVLRRPGRARSRGRRLRPRPALPAGPEPAPTPADRRHAAGPL